MRRLPQRGLVVALAALAACSRCGSAGGPPPERFVAADVMAAVVVPRIQGAARDLAAFYATAEDFPGTSQLPSLRASLSAQLGFDPLDLGALRDAGIDPRGGLAIAFPAPARVGAAAVRPPPLLVLPISNRAAAETLVRKIATDRLGAGVRTVEVIGATQVVVFRQRAGAPPAVAAGEAVGTLVLSSGPAGPAAVARALSLQPKDSLAENPAWKAARRAAGREPAVVAFIPPGSPVLSGLWAVRDGAALALDAAPRKLRARAIALLGDREPSFRALAADGDGGALVARLDPGADVVARFDCDPAALAAKLLPMIPAAERAKLAKAGIDLDRDLIGALAPGGAAALSLARRIDLPSLDARTLRRDPFRLIEFDLLLPLRDPIRAVALSERLVRLAGPRPRGEVFSVPMASGELAWAIDGERLVAAGGARGRLAALRARHDGSAGGYRPPTEDARRALASGGLGAAVLDTRNFVASVRALPQESFGAGPTGFVMRSLAERIVDPAERIDAISLRVALAEGALVLSIEIEPRPSEESP